MRKVSTLVIIVEPSRILLGMKKRGFGVGKWNGFGGKVEAQDKTVMEGAQLETRTTRRSVNHSNRSYPSWTHGL